VDLLLPTIYQKGLAAQGNGFVLVGREERDFDGLSRRWSENRGRAGGRDGNSFKHHSDIDAPWLILGMVLVIVAGADHHLRDARRLNFATAPSTCSGYFGYTLPHGPEASGWLC